MKEIIKPQGFIEIVVEDISTGKIVHKSEHNTVLDNGKAILARSLAGAPYINDPYDFFISTMVFGTGGEDGSIPRTVEAGRSSLFNQTLEISVDRGWTTDYPTRARFTGTVSTSSANGTTLNEAALKTSAGDLFSMVTFSGLSKTSSLQFTLNWTIVFA